MSRPGADATVCVGTLELDLVDEGEGLTVGWRELGVAGAWEITTTHHEDDRGLFLEWFKGAHFAATTGHTFGLAQANCSVSRAGVVRGIHLAKTPPGQAKYVTCVRGAVIDVVVDLRVGSATFGRWETVRLDDRARNAVYLSEGLGHGFCALEDDSTVVYLCSTPYSPEREHAVNPFDTELAIDWPTHDANGTPLNLRASAKDAKAPSLADALAAGVLARLEDVERHVAVLREQHPKEA